MRTCATCRVEKPLDEFYRQAKAPGGRAYTCKSCSSAYCKQYYADRKAAGVSAGTPWYQPLSPEKQRNRNLQRKFGITAEEYDAMLAGQDGLCAICGTDSPQRSTSNYFAVDHDHETGEVRGLLCSPCNIALGAFGDSPDRLMAAAAYLLQRQSVLAKLEGGL